ncbi:Fibulin-2-like protein [Aix galericulata]|nr:Fibulin-2-like protein [Aix galericulata]
MVQQDASSMTPAGALCLWLGCLLLWGAAPTPVCDPSTCSPCSEPTPGGCCPPCTPPCACPPYLADDCEIQGFTDNRVPAGLSFYIDFARKLCTCQPSGDITCTPHCPPVPPTCQAVGSPVADGCPRCVCYDKEEVAVPAGTVVSRGAQLCTCPPEGGQLQCGDGGEV